tara:strand:- start:681 stop:1562 length:882 start_codon:yes stop_codon:yes gene_type:complete
MKYFSSIEVAAMFGCNESTIRRWTEKGLLGCKKTPGGHRNFTMNDLREFIAKSNSIGKNRILKANGNELKSTLKLINELNFSKLASLLAQKSIISDDYTIHSIINNLYIAGVRLNIIFDQVVEACNDIIEEWIKTKKISHTEEYIARKLITRTIDSLCESKPNGNHNVKNALCINFEDNLPDIGIVMSEVILRHYNYNVYNTGSHAKLGDLDMIIEKQNINLVIFYLCNRQCCNAVAIDNLNKTFIQINKIIKYASKINLKILFGGEGLELIDNLNISENTFFKSYSDFIKLI